MIWGMTLNPGEEYLHEVYHQQHLTLASLDCRPGKSFEGSHPNCCLLLKTGNGEHVLCSLEKGLMHQQSLNLILHKGEKLTFFVEGTGTVYITGYSAKHPEESDGIPDEISAELLGEQQEETGELEESSETQAVGQTKNIINTTAEYLCTPVKARRKKRDKHETEEKETNTFEEFDEEQHNTTTDDTGEQERQEEDEDSAEREVTKDEDLNKDHPDTTAVKRGKQQRQKEVEGSTRRKASKDAGNERSLPKKKTQRGKKKQVTKQCVVKKKDAVKRLGKKEYEKKSTTKPKGRKQSKAVSSGKCTCEICFKQVVHLNRHIRRLHIDNFKTFRCRFCKAQFLQDRNRKIHEEKRACKHLHLKCRFCNRVAVSRHALVLHERTHTGERPFKCEVCDKTFAYKNSCQLHMKLHTGEKGYQCQFCDRKFIQNMQCISHERTHTGEKPFKCETCGKMFTNSGGFRSHKLTHLKERERPFGCRFCKKRFYRKEHMRNHEQRHTVERRFICQTCGEAFSFRKELKVHKESHNLF